jgi:glycerol-3-phosphate dehydrogenase
MCQPPNANSPATIAGGKLTTYRRMARDVVDRVAKRLHQLDGRLWRVT